MADLDVAANPVASDSEDEGSSHRDGKTVREYPGGGGGSGESIPEGGTGGAVDVRYPATYGFSTSSSDESESSEDEGGGRRGGAAAATPSKRPMDFTEAFTWITIWVMIIFFVYTSESTYGIKLRRHGKPLLFLFSIPVGMIFFMAFYETFFLQPKANRALREREAAASAAAAV